MNFLSDMNRDIPIYIVSYFNFSDKKTLVGGLRPYYLYRKLQRELWNVKLITPENSNVGSITIKENKILRFFKPILKIFPPDYSVFWGIKTFLYLKKENRSKKFIVFTTVPPHGLGIIGLLCKLFLRNSIWISDYRDLWTKNALYNPPITKKYFDPILEDKFHCYSDLVIFNTKWDLDLNIKLFPDIVNKSFYIRNGFNNQHENKCFDVFRFVYAGGTTKGEAALRIIKLLEELNLSGYCYSCDFYGEYHNEMDACKYVSYKGTIESEDVPELLTNYKFGFIYLPDGCENGGRMAQKFYDYIGSGVIPICFNTSIEMQHLMNVLGVGFSIYKETTNDELIDFLKKAHFSSDNNLILRYSRDFQFDKLIERLSGFLSK